MPRAKKITGGHKIYKFLNKAIKILLLKEIDLL